MAFDSGGPLGGLSEKTEHSTGRRHRYHANSGFRSSRRLLLGAILASTSSLALTVSGGFATADEIIDGGQTITVPGDQNSPWNLGADDLVVGESGEGRLVIENGGAVIPADLRVGVLDTASGTVTVSGPGSTLTTTGLNTQVGIEGTGAVNISDGAFLDIGGALVLGELDGGDGTLTITGNTSNMVVNQYVTVGSTGSGTVNLADGASVTNGGLLTVGLDAFRNGVVLMSGAGTNWEATQHAFIGSGGNGILILEDGASMDVGQSLVLGNALTGQGQVSVSGAGSQLTFGDASVGYDGDGIVFVENGGSFGSAGHDLVLGVDADGSGSIRLVGAGSTVTSNLTTFGEEGSASVIVSEGARLETGIAALGYQTGSKAEVSLAGAGTVWANTIDDLFIGRAGEGVVKAASGAQIDAVSYVRLGIAATGLGTLTLTGPGTALDAGVSIEVGKQGRGSVNVENGASVTHGSNLLIGQSVGALGAVTVTGTGSSWQGSGDAIVGDMAVGTFAVADGATASIAGNTVLGLHGGGGAMWADGGVFSTTTLTVGDAGGGSLFVEDGGAVLVGNGTGTIQVAAQAGSNGFISIGNGAGAGTLQAAKVQFGAGDGTLLFAHTSTDYDFDPIIEGDADIEHLSGHTTLTADSSGFIGTTSISGGTLAVNGILGGTISVDANGTLGGSGSVGNVTVASGATLAPGNSIGTLNVGDITIDAGSTYQVEVDGLGNSDLVNATGIATVNGGTVNVTPFPDFLSGTPYTILTAAGGVNGAFDTATFAINSLFVTPSLSYDANNAYLTLDVTTNFADVALTPNQKAAASGIQSVGGGALFSAIAALGTAEEARTAFDAISGEVHASAKTALIEDSKFVRDAVTNRILAAFEETAGNAVPTYAYGSRGAEAVPASTDRFALWGKGFGSWGQWNGDGNAAAMDRSVGGFLFGGDALATDNLRLGLLAGYSHTDFDVNGRSSSGSADSYHLGAYGGGRWDGFGLRFGGAYSWHDIDTSRSVVLTGYADSLSAGYRAGTAQIFGEVGHRFDLGKATIEPFANLAYVNLATRGFTENGGTAALTASSQTTHTTFTTLGLRGETSLALDDTIRLTGMLGWRHSFGDTVPVSAMAFGGGTTFTVAGVPIAQDAAVIEAGIDIPLAPQATFGLFYKGQFGSGLSDHSAAANVAVRF